MNSFWHNYYFFFSNSNLKKKIKKMLESIKKFIFKGLKASSLHSLVGGTGLKPSGTGREFVFQSFAGGGGNS